MNPWSDPQFQLDPGSYEALVDWPRRLANEEGFYRRLFERAGVRRVLDPACGTGHHAAMFHSWRLSVQGADVSPEMIEFCRARHGEPQLQWVVRSFLEPAPPPADFDAVICVGNSLALVPDLATFNRAVAALLASLRAGGVCVIQLLNLWRLAEGPVLWQKCKLLPHGDDQGCSAPGGTDAARVILKGVHRAGNRGHISVVELRLSQNGLEWQSHTSTLLGIRAEDLLSAANTAGGQDAKLYGGYHDEPYNASQSPDLILVCRRA